MKEDYQIKAQLYAVRALTNIFLQFSSHKMQETEV
jgi:hypothetical protein